MDKNLGLLANVPGIYIGNESKCRQFLNGVLWVMRSGAQRRLLSSSYGKCNSIYKRFERWCEKGIWTQMLDYFAGDADMENLILDSSIVRAHACAAGAPTTRGVVGVALARKSISASMFWAIPCGYA